MKKQYLIPEIEIKSLEKLDVLGASGNYFSDSTGDFGVDIFSPKLN